MLTIIIQPFELFDDETQDFKVFKETRLDLEHSLVSLSKWESEWEIPFLGGTEKTFEQTISYVKAMTLTTDIPPEVFGQLSNGNIEEVSKYIEAKMTATWFKDEVNPRRSREVITTEVIYYWMITASIPLECENWHLNRLLTLIRVINQKNAPEKKLSNSELAARNRSLNEQRKAQMKTSG